MTLPELMFFRNGHRPNLRAFQFVTTDKSGFLPWEPGYDESARKWQPALYEPPADAAMASDSALT